VNDAYVSQAISLTEEVRSCVDIASQFTDEWETHTDLANAMFLWDICGEGIDLAEQLEQTLNAFDDSKLSKRAREIDDMWGSILYILNNWKEKGRLSNILSIRQHVGEMYAALGYLAEMIEDAAKTERPPIGLNMRPLPDEMGADEDFSSIAWQNQEPTTSQKGG